MSAILHQLKSSDVIDLSSLYIDGGWTASHNNETIDVLSPIDHAVIARVAAGSTDDVDRAVEAAKRALPGWAETPAAERGSYLQRIAQALGGHVEELAEIMARDIGTPFELSKALQVGLPMFNFNFYSELAATFPFDGDRIGSTMTVREPIGVVACITPWNFPLHQIALKTAAAWAAGCTVVVKPSEIAPVGAWRFAELVDAIGLPPGVFNLVSGPGPTIGEALVAHPDVDMVSFTGSTRAGKRIAEVAARGVKRVSLELGGKSACVILDDADFESAITNTFAGTYINSGQSCAAPTRLLVPVDRLAEAEQIAKRVAESYTTGDPMSPATSLGPLVSETQLHTVRSYIRKGVDEGAKLVTGGVETTHQSGYFVSPTVFSDVKADMTIAQEEIFGPVLSILPYNDVDEAVEIANGTPYGLAAKVWARDPDQALRVARRLRAGQVTINDGQFVPSAPFGGYKESGLGREGGVMGLDEYLETKIIKF